MLQSNDELYFCIRLTADEHFHVNHDFRNQCELLGLEFVYYRELKEGHVPMYREVKIKGDRTRLNRFKKFLKDGLYLGQIERNPRIPLDKHPPL